MIKLFPPRMEQYHYMSSQVDFNDFNTKPMVTKIVEWSLDNQVDIGDGIQEWLNCSLYYLHNEKQLRALLTYHSTHPSHNICRLTGRYDKGQLCKVYHRETENVVDRIFVSNSLIANPVKETWMFECVPLMDITTAVHHSDIDAQKFSVSPYEGAVVDVVISDIAAWEVYQYLDS